VNPWSLIIPAVAGAGLSAWGTFHPRSRLFGPVVTSIGSACALTFDDGPNPRVTPRLLSLLDKYEVPATFFLLGKYVRAYPEIAAEVAARDHALGNHSYDHPSFVFFTRKAIIDELNKCGDAILDATGRRPDSVRPPFGFRGPQFRSAVRAAGLSKIVMWTVNGRDWNPHSGERVRRRLESIRSGDIVLLHDGDHRASNVNRDHTLEALEYWLPRWNDAGLRFAKL
jgi:peptidoglycan/xylan/chitin deacetylase (PgdA/CDA1 family)